MNRTEKVAMVERLGADLAQAPNAILFAFSGLKVPEVTELRRQVRETRSKYLVVKNTLALRATKGAALEALAEHFTGGTAVAYNQNAPVALAKVLSAFVADPPARHRSERPRAQPGERHVPDRGAEIEIRAGRRRACKWKLRKREQEEERKRSWR
jgi:hypothetical protein